MSPISPNKLHLIEKISTSQIIAKISTCFNCDLQEDSSSPFNYFEIVMILL